ncbi:MAG TPA: ImmA/IrrE family metallo-endopeptidase [Clostridia bacterium]
MTNKESIQALASNIIKRFDSRDPFELCKSAGVEVFFTDLGSLKGMYKHVKRNRFAVINENLDERTKRLVCAHELGHDLLHRDLAKNICLQEFVLYDMKSRPEYEANLFAAEILLPDDEVFFYANGGYDIHQIAQVLCSDINLVALKVASMNAKGYELRNVVDVKKGFLGK